MTSQQNTGESPVAGSAAASAVAAGDLLPLVYEELRALARQRMRQESAGHTLQATALVHEAFMRLGGGETRFVNRAHFFRVAAEAMRRILIEHARARSRIKRGGDRKRSAQTMIDLAAAKDGVIGPDEMLALDEAIERLEKESPQAAAVVRLRFFAGLSVEEAAEALGLSPRSVNREWTFARAWLFRVLEGQAE